jgi:cholesterol oxidase
VRGWSANNEGVVPIGDFDYDWLIIGSGFGGSVSALRLTEKGYRVGVLECGRRFHDEDFAKTTWNFRKYLWSPHLGMRGILRMSPFKDVFIVSGSGVGGGSLGYANTLYRARPEFFADSQWGELGNWEAELQPFYDEAERMLGVVDYDRDGPADLLLKELAEELGVEDTYTKPRVGVYFGEPGRTVADPFFGGEGPDRTGCVRCGGCMVGCRYGAKNTLVKNYLWFAERGGATVMPERTVVDVKPLGAADGSDGYVVTSERSGAWVQKDRRVHTARGVVFAAGALGTNKLLFRCKLAGSLPRISDRLGQLVRTNSEAILAVTAPDDTYDFTEGIAITSSIYPDPNTHIEPVTYGRGGDSQSMLFTLLTEGGTRQTRPLYYLLGIVRHPLKAAKLIAPWRWSRRTIILLVMQSLDNAISLRPWRRLRNGSILLTTEQDPLKPNPDSIEVANWAAKRLAEKLGGVAQAGFTEAIFGIPTTAHILGGAVIGPDPGRGVIDGNQRVYGYENMLVCDGAAVPANVGVNPSLTITALAERAMSKIPARGAEAQPERQRVAA